MSTGGDAGRSFDHMLLTRFSAVLVPGAPPATEDWLHYRLGFFYDACLPSVTRQRGAQPFEWLVLFDDRCSDSFREQVEELAEGAFKPIWSHEPFRRDTFAGHVAARAHAPYLITTRIDSDDAMAVDLMARVQAELAGQERMFVNFPRGVQIDRSGAVYRSSIVSSPLPVAHRAAEGGPTAGDRLRGQARPGPRPRAAAAGGRAGDVGAGGPRHQRVQHRQRPPGRPGGGARALRPPPAV